MKLMNREIVFRGKSIGTDEWLYGHLFNYGLTAPSNVPCISVCVPTSWEEAYNLYAVHPDTIGQYTGMKDKNGKEIYEGDIVSILSWKGVVMYNNEYASFNVRCGRSNIDIKNFFVYGGKVVGNIHDNPKLLKQQRQ